MRKIAVLSFLVIWLFVGCAPVPAPTATLPTGSPTESGAPNGTAVPVAAAPTGMVSADPTDAPTDVPAAGAGEPVQGGTVTRAISSEPPSLDPHGAAGSGQNAILPYLLDTLIYRDTDNSYKPYLAEAWAVSEDGKTITFTLRQDVTFHDGTPMNAEAVQATFARLMQDDSKSSLAGSFANVEKIEATSAYEVVFTLKQPSSTLLNTLTTAYAGIISPTAVEQSGDQFGMNPVGTGPFKLESWKPGEEIALVRNEAYAWAPPVVQNPGAPYLDKLVFKIIPDASAQLTAFQTGEVDVMFINQSSQIAKLEKDSAARLDETALNSLIYLSFNMQASPMDNRQVRLAVAHAVNKQELIQLALGGIGEAVFSPLAPTLPGFDPTLSSLAPAFDLQQSEALLTEAGFTRQPDGTWLSAETGEPLALELLTSTRAPNEALATVLQAQLKEAGIPLTIRALESAAAGEAATQGDYQVMLWRYDWNDADVLSVYLSSSRIGKTNRTFYSNPDVDEALSAAAREIDPEKRDAFYSAAQKILIEDQPWVPLYTPKDYTVTRSTLQGTVYGPMGRLVLTDAWLQP